MIAQNVLLLKDKTKKQAALCTLAKDCTNGVPLPLPAPGGGTICSERVKHGMSEKSGVEITGKKDAV